MVKERIVKEIHDGNPSARFVIALNGWLG